MDLSCCERLRLALKKIKAQKLYQPIQSNKLHHSNEDEYGKCTDNVEFHRRISFVNICVFKFWILEEKCDFIHLR